MVEIGSGFLLPKFVGMRVKNFDERLYLQSKINRGGEGGSGEGDH